jgi:hypothetical protein
MTDHTPTPWTYNDVSGAGLEIRGPVYLSKGIELPRGMPNSPIKIFEFTAPQIVQIAAERWVQFEPNGWSEMQQANAAFIVKAVNAHDALMEALEKILRANDDSVNAMPTEYDGDSLTDACDEARILLANVKS